MSTQKAENYKVSLAKSIVDFLINVEAVALEDETHAIESVCMVLDNYAIDLWDMSSLRDVAAEKNYPLSVDTARQIFRTMEKDRNPQRGFTWQALRETFEKVVSTQSSEEKLCSFCSLPVKESDAHYPHEPGCTGGDCDCDLIAHPECCPDCKE